MNRYRVLTMPLFVVIGPVALLCSPAGLSTASCADDFTPPKVITSCMVQPIYPEAEKIAGVEGMVMLSVEVKKDGKVGSIAPEQEVEGHPAFTQSAKTAVEKWCFTPAQENGEIVAATIIIPLWFRLDEKK